jgi:hypothetical protein
MKNFFIFLIFFFVFVTNSFSKILDFQSHKIDFPNKFYQLDWSDYDFMSEECSYYNICYGIVDKKLLEVFEEFKSGKSVENIEILKPLTLKYEKMMKSDKNFERNFKSLFKSFKSILKKNNSGILYSYYKTQENFNESKILEELKEYDLYFDIDDMREMSSSELKKFSKDIKSKITTGSNSVMLMDGMSINFIKFDISKDLNNTPYLIFQAQVKYVIGATTTKLGNMNYYFSEFNNKLFVFSGICVVNCSSFNSDFKQIIDNSLNQTTLSQDTPSYDVNFIDQLNQLSDLYKSGVLTKEEFEKAKKKILN